MLLFILFLNQFFTKLKTKEFTRAEKDFVLRNVHIDAVRATKRIYSKYRMEARFHPRLTDDLMDIIDRAIHDLKVILSDKIKNLNTELDKIRARNDYDKSIILYKTFFRQLRDNIRAAEQKTKKEVKNTIIRNTIRVRRAKLVNMRMLKKDVLRLRQCFNNFFTGTPRQKKALSKCINGIGKIRKSKKADILENFFSRDCCNIR